jgi:plasmid stabilization system protein ParE
MKRFKLSPAAAGDIREIWTYIAADSVKAARKVRLALFDACHAGWLVSDHLRSPEQATIHRSSGSWCS